LAFGVFLCPFDELSSGEANLTVPEQHDDAATGFSKKSGHSRVNRPYK
jgi:hypothetical protein